MYQVDTAKRLEMGDMGDLFDQIAEDVVVVEACICEVEDLIVVVIELHQTPIRQNQPVNRLPVESVVYLVSMGIIQKHAPALQRRTQWLKQLVLLVMPHLN
jgi:hypothetical protein